MPECNNSRIKYLIYLVGAFIALGPALYAYPYVIQASYNQTVWIYSQFPDSPSKKYQTFASISGTIVALIGILAAVMTFWLSAKATRKAQKKQHTITVLLDSRLSEEFQKINTARKFIFPPGETISWDSYNKARDSLYLDNEILSCERRGADALVALLNHYEFLAVGISEGDLDAAMLKKSLRGIMCRLVSDSRNVIAGFHRKGHKKAYQHLIPLYAEWRDKDATDEIEIQLNSS